MSLGERIKKLRPQDIESYMESECHKIVSELVAERLQSLSESVLNPTVDQNVRLDAIGMMRGIMVRDEFLSLVQSALRLEEEKKQEPPAPSPLVQALKRRLQVGG